MWPQAQQASYVNPYTAATGPYQQQHLNLMPQAYYPQPQIPQQQPQAAQQAPQSPAQGVHIRMVSSIDEARATIIDPGTSHLFIDNASKRIYSKYLQADGSAVLQVYALQETPDTPMVQYASKHDLEALQQQVAMLQTQLAPLFEGGKE